LLLHKQQLHFSIGIQNAATPQGGLVSADARVGDFRGFGADAMLEFLPKRGGPGSMNRFFLRGLGTMAIVGFFVGALSCAHDQQLVGISIQPGTETFGASNIPVPADAGLSVQLKAFGHYIHPPVTKDITDQVVWFSNDPQIATVSSTGMLTAAGDACGGGIVFASVTNNSSAGNRSSTGAEVVGQMNANVVCFTGATGNNALLTIDIVGAGTVTATPPNIVCATTCTLPYATGSGPITLTAAATNGTTFQGWTGCAQPQGLECTITTLSADTTITATFR
jgi:Divergent InlB B-repeat domain